jgi:hypothetical protein
LGDQRIVGGELRGKMIQEVERNCHSIEKRNEIDDMSHTMEMARMLKTEKLQKQEIIAFLVSG